MSTVKLFATVDDELDRLIAVARSSPMATAKLTDALLDTSNSVFDSEDEQVVFLSLLAATAVQRLAHVPNEVPPT